MAEAAFLELMPDTVTVAPRGTTRSLYGVSGAAGTAVSYRARVVMSPGLIRTIEGVAQRVSATAWVSSTASIPVDGVYTLPDGSTPPILSVQRYGDQVGLHHVKVMFG